MLGRKLTKTHFEEVAPPWTELISVRIEIERFTGSNWTQKIFDPALKELSIDMRIIQNRVKERMQLKIFRRVSKLFKSPLWDFFLGTGSVDRSGTPGMSRYLHLIDCVDRDDLAGYFSPTRPQLRDFRACPNLWQMKSSQIDIWIRFYLISSSPLPRAPLDLLLPSSINRKMAAATISGAARTRCPMMMSAHDGSISIQFSYKSWSFNLKFKKKMNEWNKHKNQRNSDVGDTVVVCIKIQIICVIINQSRWFDCFRLGQDRTRPKGLGSGYGHGLSTLVS